MDAYVFKDDYVSNDKLSIYRQICVYSHDPSRPCNYPRRRGEELYMVTRF